MEKWEEELKNVLPGRFWDAELNNGAVCQELKNLNNGSGIVLSGQPGIGKTYAIWAFLKVKVVIPQNCKYVNANEISRNIYNSEFIEQLKSETVLAIDDLGMEPDNDVVKAVIDEIVDARYSGHKTTVIATNLNAEDFRERYTERIIDRLREWGKFREFDLPSRRK